MYAEGAARGVEMVSDPRSILVVCGMFCATLRLDSLNRVYCYFQRRAYPEDYELIIKSGVLLKRGGFFSKKRALIITDMPRILVVDFASCVIEYDLHLLQDQKNQFCNRKSRELMSNVKVELKNSKMFFVHCVSSPFMNV